MVQKFVERQSITEVSYKCDVCKYPFEYKKDALRCEKVPTKPFKFGIGDRVKTTAKWIGMVVNRYIESPSPEANGYLNAEIWYKYHLNRYSVATEHKPNRMGLTVGDLGITSPTEEMMKKIGSYESELVKKLRKIRPNLFKFSLESVRTV